MDDNDILSVVSVQCIITRQLKFYICEYHFTLAMVSTPKERRQSKRHTIPDLQIKIADNRLYYTSIVDDISMKGLKVAGISSNFDEHIQSYTCILYAPDRLIINLDIEMKWIKHKGLNTNKTAGFQIISPPHLWREFVNRLSDAPSLIGLFSNPKKNDEGIR